MSNLYLLPGLPGRPRNEEWNQIIELRQKGYSYGMIEFRLNIPRQTVATICQKHFKTGRFKNEFKVLDNSN